MCLILAIKPGVTIPPDKLDLACDINKHGWGIAFSQGGKLNYIRSLKQPNDPKEVADELQKLRDRAVYLHLRHVTVGEMNEANSHPFVILNKKKHSVDLAMMHNGTLYDWKPKDVTSTDSDTLTFAKELVTPLAMRVAAFSGGKILGDDIFKHVIRKEIGYQASVILFVDGLGNTLVFNKDKGKEFDGYWASNDYSFEPNHIRSSQKSYPSGYSQDNDDMWQRYGCTDPNDALPWEKDKEDRKPDPLSTWEDDLAEAEKKGKTSGGNGTTLCRIKVKKDALRSKYECVCIGEKLIALAAKGEPMITKTVLRELKTPFTELAKISSLDETLRLTEQDLIELSTNYPRGMARLVVDLLAERASLQTRNNTQAEIIKEAAQA